MIERRISLEPFSFWTRNSGSGSPIVLVHGLSGSGSWWRKNVAALSDHHSVTAIDLVGFGRNRTFLRGGPLPLTFDDAAALLARWLERDFSEPVHLIGHSMGGQIALQSAAFRPDLIRSLTLVNSTGIPFALDPRPHVRSALHGVPRGVITFSRVVALDFLRAGPTAVALATARIMRGDARESMTHLHMPTLLVWGDRDPLVPPEFAQEMLHSIENAQLVVLPQAGHVSMWDAPERFNERALAFIDEIDTTPIRANENPSPGFIWGLSGAGARMAYRASGSAPSVIMIHGLGVSSAYFRPLAHEFHRRGIFAAAPDLPGFGFSLEMPMDAARHHESVILWADSLGIRDALWIGHSTGCQVVERVTAARPDLVRRAAFLSPIWSRRPNLFSRLLTKLPSDAILEEPGLIAIAAGSYWNAGLYRLLRLAAEFIPDAMRARRLPADSVVVAGELDPFSEWELFREYGATRVAAVPRGPHGVQYSAPAAVVDAILG